jgi:hypothetical protein
VTAGFREDVAPSPAFINYSAYQLLVWELTASPHLKFNRIGTNLSTAIRITGVVSPTQGVGVGAALAVAQRR